MIYEMLVFLTVLLTTATVEGYITCGSDTDLPTQCYGSGAYCCGLYNDECCWDSVYSFWWFWFIWLMVMVFIISCAICVCIRRRRRYVANPRYVIVDGTQASYGSIPQVYGYPPAGAGNQPTGPPTAPAYQEKPPEYSAVVAN
ncbi:WW domain binding protein 1-like [Mercenaria mercenaria]|uniref:WW domain binding protein 1-like n=1 Tax=Mercenaria mercenaria TaxID=6596 RepID=UPI00234EBAA7|nr:WW domain binding protein 1-like [Mercenaria mercenaria]